MKRRDLLKGGMAAGAILAGPARAFADPLGDAFDKALTPPAAPADPVATPPQPADVQQPVVQQPVVQQPGGLSAYERRLGEIARRERDKAGSKLWRTDLVGIADYARPSSLPRLHFVNMESGMVRSFLVAHGRGSDPQHDGWLKYFSNGFGSEATSRGAYLTCEWYKGKYGTSIRLEGMDADNSNALDRAIVMHPAAYVDASMIEKWGKIGRSEGCFAMSQTDFNEALWHLSGGRLLYADRISLV